MDRGKHQGVGSMMLPKLIAIALCSGFITAPVVAGALHEAVREGDTTAAAQLIAAGANVEAKDDAGLTPLITAALAGRKKTVSLLIAKGADPRGRDGKGFTALHAAAHAGHLDVVELLVAQGLDVNDQRNGDALAPLHLAAERDQRDVALALLARGATIDLKTRNGHSPVFLAALKAYAAMVRLLRDHGAQCTEIRAGKFRDYCMNLGT